MYSKKKRQLHLRTNLAVNLWLQNFLGSLLMSVCVIIKEICPLVVKIYIKNNLGTFYDQLIPILNINVL